MCSLNYITAITGFWNNYKSEDVPCHPVVRLHFVLLFTTIKPREFYWKRTPWLPHNPFRLFLQSCSIIDIAPGLSSVLLHISFLPYTENDIRFGTFVRSKCSLDILNWPKSINIAQLQQSHLLWPARLEVGYQMFWQEIYWFPY